MMAVVTAVVVVEGTEVMAVVTAAAVVVVAAQPVQRAVWAVMVAEGMERLEPYPGPEWGTEMVGWGWQVARGLPGLMVGATLAVGAAISGQVLLEAAGWPHY